jgi:hypothetical protein
MQMATLDVLLTNLEYGGNQFGPSTARKLQRLLRQNRACQLFSKDRMERAPVSIFGMIEIVSKNFGTPELAKTASNPEANTTSG